MRGVKKVLIASGVRYDLAIESPEYVKELAQHHVGGYLKIAPEAISDGPLSKMMKPGVGTYDRFKELFDKYSKEAGKEQYLIPYFIAAHPGTTDQDMLELALWLKRNGFRADQVQAFLPSPMATATAMYHSGKNPLRKVTAVSEDVHIPRGLRVRRLHKAFLRYHDPNNWPLLREALRNMGRADLIGNGRQHLVPTYQPVGTGRAHEGKRRPTSQATRPRAEPQTNAHAHATYGIAANPGRPARWHGIARRGPRTQRPRLSSGRGARGHSPRAAHAHPTSRISSAVSRIAADATFSSRCLTFDVPGDRQHDGRARQRPGDRGLRHREPSARGDLGESGDGAVGGCIARALRQRAPRDESDALRLADLQHRIGRAIGDVVAVLHGDDLGDPQGLVEFIRAEVRDADVADLALLLQAHELADRVFHRYRGIDRVQLVEIDPLELEAPQTRLARFTQMLRTAVRGPFVARRPREAALRRDHESLRIRVQRSRDQLFARAGSVSVGGVDEIDAKRHRALQHATRLRGIGRRAPDAIACHAHGAEAEPADACVATQHQFTRSIGRRASQDSRQALQRLQSGPPRRQLLRSQLRARLAASAVSHAPDATSNVRRDSPVWFICIPPAGNKSLRDFDVIAGPA